MIVLAPASRAPWITFSPTPPHPSTATLSPGCTCATFNADPTPVITPHPVIAATGNGTPSGIRVTASLRTSVRPESVPMLNERSIGCPRHRVPSAWACPRERSMTWAGRLDSHSTVSPRRHWKHSPHGMHQLRTTASPGCDVRHASADLAHDTRALMPHHQRSRPRERRMVGVTDAGGADLDQDLVVAWRRHFDVVDDERTGAVRDRRARDEHLSGPSGRR